jgi:hypothetical protein
MAGMLTISYVTTTQQVTAALDASNGGSVFFNSTNPLSGVTIPQDGYSQGVCGSSGSCRYTKVKLVGAAMSVNSLLQKMFLNVPKIDHPVVVNTTVFDNTGSSYVAPGTFATLTMVSHAMSYHSLSGVVKDGACLSVADTAGGSSCWKSSYNLAGVTVTATQADDATTAYATSNLLGQFYVQLPISVDSLGKKATVTVAKGGFGASSWEETMTAGQTLMGDVYIFATGSSIASTITGKLIDTQKNEPIVKVDVKLKDLSGNVVSTKQSGAEGEFSFATTAGIYNLEASGIGFLPNRLDDIAFNTKDAVLALSPAIEKNNVRFVLQWGKSPPAASDLDLHVEFIITDEGDSEGDKCSVTWNRRECSGVTYDIDNMQGGQYGTETITLKNLQKTIYTVYVQNYDESAATELSSVRVDAMNSGGTVLTVTSPPASATSKYQDKTAAAFTGEYRESSHYLTMICVDNRDDTGIKIVPAVMYTKEPPKMFTTCNPPLTTTTTRRRRRRVPKPDTRRRRRRRRRADTSDEL